MKRHTPTASPYSVVLLNQPREIWPGVFIKWFHEEIGHRSQVEGVRLNTVENWNYDHATSERKLIDLLPLCDSCKQVVYFDLMLKMKKKQTQRNGSI